MALATYFTYSRAGAITAAVGVVAYVALSRRRLTLLPPLIAMGGISALVVRQGSRRDALGSALDTALARSQGDEMIVTVIVGSLLAGVIVWGMAWAGRHDLLPKAPEVSRRTSLIALAVTSVVLLVGFVGAGGPGYANDRFNDFKQPTELGADATRLTSANGNGRWQYWSSAVDAFESAPVKGIGPGGFQFWWNENRNSPGVIRDAHSLFVENLAELGIVGFLLIVSFFALVLVAGVWRALGAAGERRAELAALTGAAMTFTLGASVDWLWELAVLPVAFLIVAAAILATRDDDEDREAEDDAGHVQATTEAGNPYASRRELALRVGGGLAAIALAVGIYIPAAAAQHLADSRNAFAEGDYAGALADANAAADLIPYAGAPRMQQAFALEANEEFAKAAAAAREATEREPDNWEAFYLLSRVQAQRGDDKRGAALRALRRAQELNPLSTLVNPVDCDVPGNPCGVGETPLG